MKETRDGPHFVATLRFSKVGYESNDSLREKQIMEKKKVGIYELDLRKCPSTSLPF